MARCCLCVHCDDIAGVEPVERFLGVCDALARTRVRRRMEMVHLVLSLISTPNIDVDYPLMWTSLRSAFHAHCGLAAARAKLGPGEGGFCIGVHCLRVDLPDLPMVCDDGSCVVTSSDALDDPLAVPSASPRAPSHFKS